MYHTATFHTEPTFTRKALHWASSQGDCMYLSPQSYSSYPLGAFRHLVAVGVAHMIAPGSDSFGAVYAEWASSPNWMFGHWGYDLKNELEPVLHTRHTDPVGFPKATFWRPKHVIEFLDGEVVISSMDSPTEVFEAIKNAELKVPARSIIGSTQHAFSKAEYIATVERLKNHIEEGDVYEINLCQPFRATAEEFNPLVFFEKLSHASPMPFSAFYQLNGLTAACASPERFMKKEGQWVWSQPMKGTSPRSSDPTKDGLLAHALKTSEKERAENMMIIDLVRNDLARSAKPGTITVPSMFEVLKFPRVHQMISTVQAQLSPEATWADALQLAFPMGSMTGAPKVKSMELIDTYEKSARGLFSGSIGYITPSGDFDFNVVIRTLFHNPYSKSVHWWAGSAITYDSDPAQEYEECLLKARAIEQVLAEMALSNR